MTDQAQATNTDTFEANQPEGSRAVRKTNHNTYSSTHIETNNISLHVLEPSEDAADGIVPFETPLMTKVGERLWQGGCRGSYPVPPFIDHVLSLYPWERYSGTENLETFVEVKMDDSVDEDYDLSGVEVLADWVNQKRELGNVLVHCQAGLNRSGLVVARSIMLDEGISAERAIARLRNLRSPEVLCNYVFERWLLAHDELSGPLAQRIPA